MITDFKSSGIYLSVSLRISSHSHVVISRAAVVESRRSNLEPGKNHWQCMNLGPIPKVFCAPLRLSKSSNVTDLAVCVYIVSLNLACLEPFKLHQHLSSRRYWPWPVALKHTGQSKTEDCPIGITLQATNSRSLSPSSLADESDWVNNMLHGLGHRR